MTKSRWLIFPASLCLLLLVSWGPAAHRVMATIAQKHLSPTAKAAIDSLLGKQTLADVASWADEVQQKRAFKNTGEWHFVPDIPIGLTQDPIAFDKMLAASAPNINSAILQQQAILKDKTSTKKQKIIALKFLINLVGDAHDPMHLNRVGEQKGSTIPVIFNVKNTTLQWVWENGLIEQQEQSLSNAELADVIEKTTPPRETSLMVYEPSWWLYKTYQQREALYTRLEQPHSPTEADDYPNESDYKSYTTIADIQLDLAGLRLALLLNRLYPPPYKGPVKYIGIDTIEYRSTDPPYMIMDSQAASRVGGGEVGLLPSRVYSHEDMGDSVLLYLGAPYPHQLLTIVLRGEARFIARTADGRDIVAESPITGTRDKPEMEITLLKNIRLRPVYR